VSWITISLVGITRMYLLYRSLNFSEEETKMIETVLGDMPKHKARAFLNLGFWVEGEQGTVLTTENVPVSHLYYLAEGEASVVSGGRMVALVRPQHFIGEITCMSGEPAHGTVALTKPSYYFAVEVAAMRAFLDKNPDIRDMLEMAFAQQLRHKLVALNRVVASQSMFAGAAE
jgi:CRP-like cAMP-binding protein